MTIRDLAAWLAESGARVTLRMLGGKYLVRVTARVEDAYEEGEYESADLVEALCLAQHDIDVRLQAGRLRISELQHAR